MSDEVLGAFDGPHLRMASRYLDLEHPTNARFKARAAEKSYVVRPVSWAGALAAASPGFKRSLRMLRRAIEQDEAWMKEEEARNAEACDLSSEEPF